MDSVLIDQVVTRVNVKKVSLAMDGSVLMWTNVLLKSHPVMNAPSALTNRVLIAARIVSSRLSCLIDLASKLSKMSAFLISLF